MPLIRRTVLPTNLCLTPLPEHGVNELEMVTNNTLAGVISQLSDLSRHAEDIFGELTNEAHNFNDRCLVLGERIVQLNDVISLESQNHRAEPYPIKSRDIKVDHQVVSRVTLPKALKMTYQQADPPPPLGMLQKYRDDNKDPLKIYTNPDYFFELWRDTLQKEMEKARHDRKAKKRRAKEKEKLHQINKRPPANVNEIAPEKRIEDQLRKDGVEFVDDAKKQAKREMKKSEISHRHHPSISDDSGYCQPTNPAPSASLSFPQNLPPPSETLLTHRGSTDFPPPLMSPPSPHNHPSRSPPPAPQFPIPCMTPPSILTHNTSPHGYDIDMPAPPMSVMGVAPPPPPPPPPPTGLPPPPGGLPPVPPFILLGNAPAQIEKPKTSMNKPTDSRTNLLKQIQEGKALRRTEIRKMEERAPIQAAGDEMIKSVQRMLEERRLAIYSESDTDSEWENDD